MILWNIISIRIQLFITRETLISTRLMINLIVILCFVWKDPIYKPNRIGGTADKGNVYREFTSPSVVAVRCEGVEHDQNSASLTPSPSLQRWVRA